MNKTNETIGDRIRQKRNYLDLSIPQLAEKCHVDEQVIESWGNNESEPQGKTFYLLSCELKTNTTYLSYGGSDDYSTEHKYMGYYIMPMLVVMAIIALVSYIYMWISLPKGTGFGYILIGILIFCVFYWMAAVLNSLMATWQTMDSLLNETIKLYNKAVKNSFLESVRRNSYSDDYV